MRVEVIEKEKVFEPIQLVLNLETQKDIQDLYEFGDFIMEQGEEEDDRIYEAYQPVYHQIGRLLVSQLDRFYKRSGIKKPARKK